MILTCLQQGCFGTIKNECDIFYDLCDDEDLEFFETFMDKDFEWKQHYIDKLWNLYHIYKYSKLLKVKNINDTFQKIYITNIISGKSNEHIYNSWKSLNRIYKFTYNKDCIIITQ
jgi:hypothetical protein